MRKRKKPEVVDPLDPTQYFPNVGHLQDCAWMASGMVFPSLCFMATLVWGRTQADLLKNTPEPEKQEELYPTVIPPANLPSDILTYLAWSLCWKQYLQFPSGAKVMVMTYEIKGTAPDKISWEIYFPERMGGTYASAELDYDILQSGLHKTHYNQTVRPHNLFLKQALCHITGDPQPALAKRGRWFAPRPHLITEAKPPGLAKKFLKIMWERKNTEPHFRNIHGLCHHYVCLGVGHNQKQVFGVLLWLFLKGYIKMTRGGNLAGRGPVFSYRQTRHKNVITDYTKIPIRVYKTIRDCLAYDHFIEYFYADLRDTWNQMLSNHQTHLIHRKDIHEITKVMYAPLVVDVMLDLKIKEVWLDPIGLSYGFKRDDFLYKRDD